MIRETFTENWKMKEVGTDKSYEVSVPSSVLSVLLDNGVIEDPFYRDNELKCREFFEKDYEFTRVFSVSGDIIREDEIDLVFYGIDTLADIYLNDRRISYTSNMHCTYRFGIKDKIIPGSNELKIILHSPLKYISEYTPSENKEVKYIPCGGTKGNQYIRKAHSMFGWDWGPQLPDLGIFRKVELEAYSKVVIKEVFFNQIHENGEVSLVVDPILKITDSIPVEIAISVSGQKEVSNVIRMPEEGEKETPKGRNEVVINIKNPKLWWPNGQGEPNLYDVKIVIRKSDIIFDEREYKIGLRTLSVSRKKDEWGEEFAFVINGRKIFAMGADYIPEDCIYSRIDRAKIESLVSSAAKANYNMLRVWGGGYYPSDDFFDLCDQYGIIVWQDLMYACNVYDLTPEFEKNIIAETHDNVSRIRHHACLGLWCGNNELESGWAHWYDFQKETPYLRADYIKMFEHVLPEAVRESDGETFYWPSSPSSGGCFDNPDDENRGDAHYWDVWHGQKPFKEYRNHYFRFLSEFGFQSFPCKKTVDSFTIEEDQNIFSYVMEQHQKNGWANGKILYYISENFLYPKDFESLLYVSQILQGIAIKYGVEHMRRNRGRCMGSLYWQINDNWPVASWSSVDYFGRWKALHYLAKRFYSPIAGSIERIYDADNNETNIFSVSITNDSPDPVSFKVRLSLHEMDGKEIAHFDETGRVLSGKVAKLRDHDFSRYVAKKGKSNVYLQAEFAYSNGMHAYEYETFVPYKHLNLKQPMVTFDVKELENEFELEVETDTFTPFLVFDFKDRDAIFEENVVTVTKGNPYTIRLKKSEIKGEPFKDADELCEHIDIWFLQRSFMFFAGDKEDEFNVNNPLDNEDKADEDITYDDFALEVDEFGNPVNFEDSDIIFETEEELKARLREELKEELRKEIVGELNQNADDAKQTDPVEEVDAKEPQSVETEGDEEHSENVDASETKIGKEEALEGSDDVSGLDDFVTEDFETEVVEEPEEIIEDEPVTLVEQIKPETKRGYYHKPMDGIRIREDSEVPYSGKLFQSVEHLPHNFDDDIVVASDDEAYEEEEQTPNTTDEIEDFDGGFGADFNSGDGFYENPEFTEEELKRLVEEDEKLFYGDDFDSIDETAKGKGGKKSKFGKKPKKRIISKLEGIRIK